MRLARSICLATMLVAAFSSVAHAQGSIAVRWDDCAPVGAIEKSFACDTNTGDPFDLILSVSPPVAIPEFVGFVAVVDLDFEMQVTPSWWDFPGCRPSNSIHISQASSDLSCPDISEIPFVFYWDYDFGVGYPGRARLRVAAAVSEEQAFPLSADSLVALCRVSISRQLTVGAGSCAGCATPVCISFKNVLLDSRVPSGDIVVNSGSKYFAQFQQPIVCPFVGSPATRSTWGQIKSLYR